MELIDKLYKNGFELAVVSNKQAAAVESLCKECFPLISVAMGEMESKGIRRKPYPDMVIKAMERLGSDKKRCCYVGDSEVDILTAKNTGIDCISVSWGFRDKEFLREQGAVCIADTAESLFSMLNE